MTHTENDTYISSAKEAYRNRRLVLFIGAGVSMGSDYPGWPQLISPLAKRLNHELDTKPSPTQLTKIASLYADRYGHPSLEKHFREQLNRPNSLPNSIHNIIARSSVERIYTTNYDNLIEQAFRNAKNPCSVVLKGSDFPRYRPPKLFKICGDLECCDSIVSTFIDYHNFDATKQPFATALQANLQEDFLETVQ